MATISNANAAKITKMNRAAQNVAMGTLIQTLQTAQSSADSSASAISTLESEMTAAEIQLDTSASAISTLESEMTAAEIQLDTSASAITTLEGQVITTGSLTVTAAMTNASLVTVETGLGLITGWHLETYTSSGSALLGAYVENSSGSLLVQAVGTVPGGYSGSFGLNDDDRYYWIAW